ncbi:MAG: hypothetical protein MO847_09800 [Candidatus Protistobacter heckmanni]|nr:hypothetical protein [Candidatus Protistobacter heckmanni]
MFIDIFNTLAQVKAGTVVPLAASGNTHFKVLPDPPPRQRRRSFRE